MVRKSAPNITIRTGAHQQLKVADANNMHMQVCNTKSVIIVLEHKRGLYVILTPLSGTLTHIVSLSPELIIVVTIDASGTNLLLCTRTVFITFYYS